MENLIQFIMWALPSGGFGAGIAWLASRRLRQTRQAKEVHDTYKQMYDDVSSELTGLRQQSLQNYEKTEELIRENMRTRRSLNRLSRAIEAIQLCPYRAACPVRSELQDAEGAEDALDAAKHHHAEPDTKLRQHTLTDEAMGPASDCATVTGKT